MGGASARRPSSSPFLPVREPFFGHPVHLPLPISSSFLSLYPLVASVLPALFLSLSLHSLSLSFNRPPHLFLSICSPLPPPPLPPPSPPPSPSHARCFRLPFPPPPPLIYSSLRILRCQPCLQYPLCYAMLAQAM